MKKVIDKANTRGHFDHGWLITNHTFSFADYYNPNRMHFGTLRVLNDDLIKPERGFDKHPHQNMEIITIPLKGLLKHGDSLKNSDIITRGQIQLMSAGTGIYHLEYNGGSIDDLELLQIWVLPKENETTPKYENHDIKELLKHNEISLFMSPNSKASINQDAWFSLANLDKSQTKTYNFYGKNTGVYLFVIEGEIELDGETFSKRDGIGISEASSFEIKTLQDSEILFMEVSM